MNHNKIFKFKTLNECKEMSFKKLEKYRGKYIDWDMAYSEGLSIIYEEKELMEDMK